MLRRILFFSMIIIILNISFVFGTIYKIDVNNDGIIGPGDITTEDVTDLQWRISFATHGDNDGTKRPKLTVSGDASYSIEISSCSFFDCSSGYKAGWSSKSYRYSGSNIYYTFEHYMSDFNDIDKTPVGVGTYKFNMVAYGDAPSPPTLESNLPASLARWADENCGNPFTTGEFPYNENFETSDSICASNLNGATICPVCKDITTSCTEYDPDNGYLCNGVYAEIKFYDGDGDLPYIIRSDDWDLSMPGRRTYEQDDGNAKIEVYTWITDTTPSIVNVTQTIYIFENCFTAADCPDPGVCLNPTCISDQCGEDFVPIGGTDVGCVGVCNGIGGCVECTQDSHCPADTWTNNYRCKPTNPQQIQRQSLNYTCSSNTCVPSNPWYDKTLCSSPQVCVEGSSTCCTPNCGSVSSPHECGSNDCGGSCGTCLEPTPNCNEDYTCEGTGLAYWANMNGDKIGDGSSVTHSEIGDSVLLIYKNMGAYINTYNFVISEKDGGSYDTVRTIPASETFNYRGNLAAKWIINSSEFYLKSDGLINKEAEFYFDVNGNKSNELKVNDSSTTPPDAPTVIIKEPKMDSKVRVGKVLEFNQTAKDDDDDLKIRWTFEDGDNSEWMLNCLTTGNCNTTHAYETSGTKIIEILAREMTRTQEAVNYSQVFAYAPGINVFAVITSPPFGKIFTGLGAIDVFFNASRTYIANCTTLACSTCTYDVEDLHCYDLSKADIPSKYNLDFNWTFSEGVGRTGRWDPNTDYNRVVNFTRLFIAPTAHWAKLRVDYNPKIA